MSKVIPILVLTLAACTLHAQPVFLDEFDGNQLAPHWVLPPASRWEYNVSGGMLNVTGLFYPSAPKAGYNTADMTAGFNGAGISDFEFLVRAGWDPRIPGSDRQITLAVASGSATIGQFRYVEAGSSASAFLALSNGTGGPPGVIVPSPGLHDFHFARMGAELQFSFDGALVATLPTVVAGSPTQVYLQFSIGWPNQGLSPIHVDSVAVVPGPPTLAAFAVGAIVAVVKRRWR